MTRVRSTIHALAALAAVLATTACSDAFGSRYQAPYHAKVSEIPDTLHISDAIGSIAIQAWNRPYVQVDAVKKAASAQDVNAIAISVKPSGKGLEIATDLGSGNHRSVDFTISAPATTSVSVDSSVGKIDISGFERNVTANASVGKVTITMAQLRKGQVIDASSSVGKIDLSVPHDADAAIDATTSVGSIDGNNVPFSIQRQSVGANGSATLGSGGATVHLSTSTGSITVDRE